MSTEYPSAVPYDPETRQPWIELIVSRDEYTLRLRRVREEMRDQDLDGLLIVANAGDSASLAYLANYRPHFGTTLLLIPLEGEPVVISDAILHGEPMHSMLWDVIFEDLRPAAALPNTPPGSLSELAADALREKGLERSRIGIVSPANISAAHARTLWSELPDVDWRDGTLTVLKPRAIKSEAEIQYFRAASRITRRALDIGVQACSPGISERAIARIIHAELVSGGAEHIGFDTAVSSGPRAGLKHAAPTNRILEAGDMVFLDTGAVVGGYHADLSRTLAVGQADGDLEAMLATALEMFNACLKVIKPGNSVRDIYRAAERSARRSGFIADYMPNGLGHGLGLSLFEMPFLGPSDESLLETGMVFALEPMLVRYGVGTAVIEESVLVTADGAEILSGANW